MKYLLIEKEIGRYLNEEQDKRYDIIECHEAIGPRASEFKEFDTLEHALEYYGLTDPNAPVKEETEKVVTSETENTTQEEATVSETESVEEILAYKKEESPAGTYQDKDGERYNILSQSFEEVPEGWTAFESEEEAAAAWDLTPIEEE